MKVIVNEKKIEIEAEKDDSLSLIEMSNGTILIESIKAHIQKGKRQNDSSDIKI